VRITCKEPILKGALENLIKNITSKGNLLEIKEISDTEFICKFSTEESCRPLLIKRENPLKLAGVPLTITPLTSQKTRKINFFKLLVIPESGTPASPAEIKEACESQVGITIYNIIKNNSNVIIIEIENEEDSKKALQHCEFYVNKIPYKIRRPMEDEDVKKVEEKKNEQEEEKEEANHKWNWNSSSGYNTEEEEEDKECATIDMDEDDSILIQYNNSKFSKVEKNKMEEEDKNSYYYVRVKGWEWNEKEKRKRKIKKN